jgi:hypothetical protein
MQRSLLKSGRYGGTPTVAWWRFALSKDRATARDTLLVSFWFEEQAMEGMILAGIIFWLGGFVDHRYTHSEDLVQSSQIFKFLQIIPRNDGQMTLRGLALQLGSYFLIVGGILGEVLFIDQELQVTFYFLCVFIALVFQALWLFITRRRYRKK